MHIYWLVMSGLLLLPWSLIFAAALALAYRRLSSGARRRDSRVHPVWIFLVLLTVLAGATVAFAAEPVVTPLERLHDGVRDLATGWTRIFQVIAVETVGRGPNHHIPPPRSPSTTHTKRARPDSGSSILAYCAASCLPERSHEDQVRRRALQPAGFTYDTTTSSWKRMKGDFLASSRAFCREALACFVLAFGRIAWKNLT